MKFLEVGGEGFFSLRRFSIPLDRPGVTVVFGLNGSGKSAVTVEAITWTIFGRILRSGVRPDDVVRHGSKTGSYTYVRIGINGHEVRVERYRKHPKHKNRVRLIIDGVDRTGGTNKPITQPEIEAALGGVDYETFLSTVVFCARDDVRAFFTATDADRKRLLDRIFRLDWIDPGYAVADDERKAAKSAHEHAGAAYADARAEYKQAKRALRSLPQGPSKAERAKVAAKLAARERAVAKAKRAEAAADERMDALLADFKQAKREDAERERLYERSLSESRAHYQQGLQDQSEARAELRMAEDNLSKADRAKVCRTCGQPVKAKDAKRQKRKAAEARRAAAFKLDAADVGVLSLKARLDEAEAARPKPTATIDAGAAAAQRERRKAVKAYRKASDRLERVKSRLARLEQDAKRAAKDRTRAEQAVQGANAARQDAKRGVREAARDLTVAEYAAETFREVRSHLLDSLLPAINRRATRYAEELLEAGSTVLLKSTTELRSRRGVVRDKLSVEATIPGRAQGYGGFSRGQRNRVNVCLMLAMRDVAMRGRPDLSGQLFVDEAFDGVDVDGIEAMGSMLKRIAKRTPMLVVTHERRLRNIANCLINVAYNGKESVVEVA